MKKVLLGLGILVIGYLILCMFGSKEVDLERSVVMEHPADSVYKEIIIVKTGKTGRLGYGKILIR